MVLQLLTKHVKQLVRCQLSQNSVLSCLLSFTLPMEIDLCLQWEDGFTVSHHALHCVTISKIRILDGTKFKVSVNAFE